ncbi:MAG: sigma-70 family RNA polymerase sigma factor [Clostridia bacterium]|nr:sigma-70 family RNA polymerase sigma factor [Clostridia bacterium]
MHNRKIEKLYQENYSIVYKYLCCITQNSDLAEELTQETFYKMIQSIDSFKGNCKLSSWLCEIGKNLWYDELRKKKRKSNLLKTFESNPTNDMEETLIQKEKISKAYQSIQKLDKQTRRVMYLRLNSELTFKEIGHILGKTENWARVTYYRGKKKVKESDDYEN